MGKTSKLNSRGTLEKVLFSLPAFSLCLLLLFPFLFFCFRLNSLSLPERDSFIFVFLMTLFQTGLSSILSLGLAILGSLGLISLSQKRYYFFIEGLVLLPCLIPPLFLVLSLVQIVEVFISFPFGLPALIFTQVLVSIGLCSVALTRSLLKEAPLLSEWAYLHGSSPSLFLKKLLKSLLLKDIKTLFVLLLAFHWTGLSLPLLTSGSPSFSLEFFIYEHLKDPHLWPQALSLILFQSGFIFFFCFWAFSKSSSDFSLYHNRIYLLDQPLFSLIPFLALFFSIGGLFFISDLSVFFKLWELRSTIFSLSVNSVILSISVGALSLLFFVMMSLSFQNRGIRKFVVSFVAPGASFVGFALLLVPFYSWFFVMGKWILGLSLLLFPWLYRFRGERALSSLDTQCEMASFLGAGPWLIFRKIIWPRSRSLFFLCAGLASFWACGDFAYSLIVSTGQSHLSLLIYEFFSSYRLDEAVLLTWLWLLLSFLILLFWLGLSWFFDEKRRRAWLQ